jgi:hypothetical protein
MIKVLNRDPCAPRKARASDTGLAYDAGPKVIARPSMPQPVASTPASRTANVIRNFLESGPRSRQEVIHHLLLRNCEENTLADGLALLGAVERSTMFLPARGVVIMIALPGQRVEKFAADLAPVAPRCPRRPDRLGPRKI